MVDTVLEHLKLEWTRRSSDAIRVGGAIGSSAGLEIDRFGELRVSSPCIEATGIGDDEQVCGGASRAAATTEDASSSTSPRTFARDRALRAVRGGARERAGRTRARQANMAAYFTMLDPGDPILGMDLSHGGHLTHGSKVNISVAAYFDCVGVRRSGRRSGRIDYDAWCVTRPDAVKPKVIVAGASAYPRDHRLRRAFGDIAREVGARAAGRHGAHRGPRGDRPPPVPGTARGRRHHARRTRRSAVPGEV